MTGLPSNPDELRFALSTLPAKASQIAAQLYYHCNTDLQQLQLGPNRGPSMTVTIIAQAKDKDAPAPDKSAVARKAMVDNQIRTNDVTDPALVAALRDTPREPHLPVAQQAAAYVDRALPLTATRGLNPPLTTARLIADAQVRAGQSVLLIGAATGYAAALLARMGAIVTAVEDDPALVAIARDALHGRGGITVIDTPLVAGAPVAAPYDCLIVDGAIAALPTALLAQLRPGARIACGLAGGPVTRLARGVAIGDDQPVRPMPFVELECVHLPGFAPPPRFTF